MPMCWGSQEDRDSIAAIQKSIDMGVNWIDTAAIYGLGHSEEVVGQGAAGDAGGDPVCVHQVLAAME